MRWARRLLIALSFALCLATALAWPSSFYRGVTVRRVTPGLVLAVRVGSGRAGLFWQTFPNTINHSRSASLSASTSPVRDRFFRASQRWRETVRFDWTAESWRTPSGASSVARSALMPLWFPLLWSALPPSIAAQRRLTRHRRAARGQCVDCGYDLQHSPERCPECGKSVPASAIVPSLPLR